MYVIYNQSSQYLELVTKFYTDNQTKMRDYVSKHYENVALKFQDNWVRMEITKLKDLSTSDVKKTITDLYDFLSNYQYLEKMQEVKSNLYQEAISFMKKDVKEQKDDKEKETDGVVTKLDGETMEEF